MGFLRGGRSLGALHPGDEPAHVGDAQHLQPLGAQHGDQVEADVRLVLVVGAELSARLDVVLQPVGQPFGELRPCPTWSV